MKKIIVSVVTAIASITLIGGSTGSVSDQETSGQFAGRYRTRGTGSGVGGGYFAPDAGKQELAGTYRTRTTGSGIPKPPPPPVKFAPEGNTVVG